LLLSACLFIYNLVKTQLQSSDNAFEGGVEFADPIHPVSKIPSFLNDFRFWNKVIAVLMIISFGIPILQFFFMQTFGSSAWGY
jgi:cytochrome c oxidase subunit 1